MEVNTIASPTNPLNLPYNTLHNVRKGCEEIINYLFEYCPNLWKLLKYGDDHPLSKPDLTPAEKGAMIQTSSDPNEMATKNVLFQLQIPDGLSIAINQIRIEIGDDIPVDPHKSGIPIWIQIVVPITQCLISTPYSNSDNRPLAIMQELKQALNGVQFSSFVSQLYQDKGGIAGGKTGAYRQSQNKDYAGYLMCIGAWCD